jgi:allantoicase
MSGERPFSNESKLFETADKIWFSLGPADWLEAFRAHPKIGEKKPQQETSSQSRAWSEQEQAAARNVTQKTHASLARLNQDYEAKFGYIYIVCASGKTAEEMLALLKQRLHNQPDEEIRIAAREQSLITRLRLEKLLTL